MDRDAGFDDAPDDGEGTECGGLDEGTVNLGTLRVKRLAEQQAGEERI
jgi:hypothetical protein